MTKWALYHKCKEDQNKKKGKKYLITNEKKKTYQFNRYRSLI